MSSRPSEGIERIRRIGTRAAALALAFALVAGGAAHADEPTAEEPALAEARTEFLRGAELVKDAQWAEALAAFERSLAKRPHAVTRYNIGACQRALGQYTRAKKTFQAALTDDHAAGGGQLSESLLTEIRGYVGETDRLLARVAIRLKPLAAVSVDGRPLELEAPRANPPVLVAGVRPPGLGEAPPAEVFEVVLDPGAHVFTLSRKGFADAVVNRTFSAGSRSSVVLELERLPAVLHVATNRDGAVVTVDGHDVGPAPVDVSRTGGTYRVVVRKKGFVTYDTRVTVQPGERTTLRATLPEEKPSVLERWWFWTAAGVVVTGAVVATYAATRPEPERPALNGGGLGWAIDLR